MKIESYKHRMPCWICLQTSDIDNSKEFYSELFGWEYTATEMMPGMSESPIVFNASKGDDLVGVIAPQLGESDIPALWPFNWAVDDVDVCVAKSGKLGGSVTMPPMDIADQGRVAVVIDPNGVEAILWQRKEHNGADVMFEHGSFTWAQLVTRNHSVSTSFYSQLLGLDIDSGPAPGGVYNDVLMLGNEPMAGIVDMPDELTSKVMPNHWIIYFHTNDVDASVHLVIMNGGTLTIKPDHLTNIGRISIVADPQGAIFGLVTPA